MWRKTNPGRLLSTSCYKGWQDLAGGHAALKLIRSVPICMHICPFRDWSVSETFFLGTRTQYVSTSLYISLQDENLKRWMMVSWDSNESRFCLETVWDSEWGQFWVRTVFKNCLAIVVSIQPHVFKDFGSMEARIWKILELYIYIYKSPVFLNIAKTYNHKLCRVSMICLVFIPVHMPITLKHWNLILSFFPLSFCDELTPSHLPVFVPVSYTPDMWTS